MRVVLLAVLFIAMTQAWSKRGRVKTQRWNPWVSKTEKVVSAKTDTWSKWGSKLSSRLMETESRKVVEDADTTKDVKDVVVDDSKTDSTDLEDRKVSSKRGQSSDSDDKESVDSEDKDTSDSEEKDTSESEDKENKKDRDSKKRDSDVKDFVRSKVPEFDLQDMDSAIDFLKPTARFGKKFEAVSGEFEEKFGSKFELPKFDEEDFLTKFRKFDGPVFGREFEGKDSSVDRKFDSPKFNNDKVSRDDEDCEKDSSKQDSSIDFSLPKFDLNDLEHRIPEFDGLWRKFKSHGEDSSFDSEDKDSSDHDKAVTADRFDWRKFHPRPTFPFSKDDSERKVKDVATDDVKDTTVVDDVEDKVFVDDVKDTVVDDTVDDVVVDTVDETTEDVQEATLEVVVPEASRPCENCGPSRRKL